MFLYNVLALLDPYDDIQPNRNRQQVQDDDELRYLLANALGWHREDKISQVHCERVCEHAIFSNLHQKVWLLGVSRFPEVAVELLAVYPISSNLPELPESKEHDRSHLGMCFLIEIWE